MNKILLILRREFLNRVQKKSFLIATILIPLIFPTVISVMVTIMLKQEKNARALNIEVLDQSEKISLTSNQHYNFIKVSGDLEAAKTAFNKSDHYALLYIPEFNLSDPKGFSLYAKENPSISRIQELEKTIEEKIRDLKLEAYHLDKKIVDDLKTSVNLQSVSLSSTGEEKTNNSGVMYGLGFGLGLLIYMFVLIYGMQIMMGVIEEKTSKVVEVIVSSVRPFQLMMGKILGIASVGLLQFFIWVILITTLSAAAFSFFGIKMPQQQAMEQVMQNNQTSAVQSGEVIQVLQSLNEIPLTYIVFNFAFYFLGGCLLYGALFAAVGSAVDSSQEAQQFTLPITFPLIIGYFGLFMFILNDPTSTASFWLSVIPLTSPVAMVGRLAFKVPLWQLLLSQAMLIGGFILTTWIAGRIYRVGILTHGSKVSYKVLAKWFLSKQ